jgi:hypothetical protein
MLQIGVFRAGPKEFVVKVSLRNQMLTVNRSEEQCGQRKGLDPHRTG